MGQKPGSVQDKSELQIQLRLSPFGRYSLPFSPAPLPFLLFPLPLTQKPITFKPQFLLPYHVLGV